MADRVIAIGDIHGFSASLAALLRAIDPQSDDVVVTLGDYCDRGPDTRSTVDQLIALAARCRLIPILGNHDEMLLDILDGYGEIFDDWLMFGGNMTLLSYGCSVPEELPGKHVDFFRFCRPYYETDTHFFVHASYLEHLPLADQPSEVLRWESLRDRFPAMHYSQRTAVVGHTAQHDGEVLDAGYLKCIDTYCYGDGWLTALDVTTGQIWQADPEGNLRQRQNDAADER